MLTYFNTLTSFLSDFAHVQALYSKIKSGVFYFRSGGWKDISPMAQDLVSKLLEGAQLRRLTVQQALAHPWFQMSTGADRVCVCVCFCWIWCLSFRCASPPSDLISFLVAHFLLSFFILLSKLTFHLAHSFLFAEELSVTHLSCTVQSLRSFQATQRFRKGVNAGILCW